MLTTLRYGFAAAAALALSACAMNNGDAGTGVGDATYSMKGLSWRLIEMHSMHDAQGSSRPANPADYTMRLEEGGRASFQLDCNRGTGSWNMVAGGPDSGSISFGPIASTKMACPPPSLGDRLANDLANVRGYRLIDGRLSLSLMADGGILIWERADTAR